MHPVLQDKVESSRGGSLPASPGDKVESCLEGQQPEVLQVKQQQQVKQETASSSAGEAALLAEASASAGQGMRHARGPGMRGAMNGAWHGPEHARGDSRERRMTMHEGTRERGVSAAPREYGHASAPHASMVM